MRWRWRAEGTGFRGSAGSTHVAYLFFIASLVHDNDAGEQRTGTILSIDSSAKQVPFGRGGYNDAQRILWQPSPVTDKSHSRIAR